MVPVRVPIVPQVAGPLHGRAAVSYRGPAMSRVREWLDIATDRTIVRRSAITGAVVSVVLTAVDHGGDLVARRVDASIAIWIGLAFIIPFLASTIAGVAAVRERRAAGIASNLLLEREIQAVNKFPDQNPNPVLRVDQQGVLLYANPASEPIRAALGVEVGDRIGPDRWAELEAAADGSATGTIELVQGSRTFELLTVRVPELGVLNLYGTDITAAKVVERFPAGNPNPVLRMTPEGEVIYANRASEPITRALGLRLGDRLPAALRERLRRAAGMDGTGPEDGRVEPAAGPIEVHGEGRTYELTPVLIEEFGFVNIYGTDVTARKAVDKFPDPEPEPGAARVARRAAPLRESGQRARSPRAGRGGRRCPARRALRTHPGHGRE